MEHTQPIAILTEDGFEEIELTSPQEALENAGFKTVIVSPQPEKVRAKEGDEWTKDYAVDVALSEAKASDYAGLLLPGGVINPDKLRVNSAALQFIQAFAAAGKPIAAICHGPQVLISADLVRGKKLTSVEAIAVDLKNAGAQWEDRSVVHDAQLVTSRTPEDLPDFNAAIVSLFGGASASDPL